VGISVVSEQPIAVPDVFLSYTRIDNDYFGGAITSLRKSLEQGVQVVTGERNFDIFQDIDGIEFGQQWQKILDQAISGTRLLLPIVTPLFFSSPGCRDELQKFLDHEKSLGRDDMILPVYYVNAPVLERPNLLANDPLAQAIAARQRYDWRALSKLRVDDPSIKSALWDLANKLADAVARTEAPSPQSNVAGGGGATIESPLAESAQDSHFRAALTAVRNAEPERPSMGAPRTVLWVDNNPDNNILERHAMETYNIRFELARSTGEALAKLDNAKFDAIISDMGRPQDHHAGYTLLEDLRGKGNMTPYFIYSAANNPERLKEALQRKAQGATNQSDELTAMVLAYLNKPAAS
jgi:Response regulator receiver domain/TIR domain